jgi:hypothetical protein
MGVATGCIHRAGQVVLRGQHPGVAGRWPLSHFADALKVCKATEESEQLPGESQESVQADRQDAVQDTMSDCPGED